MVTIAWVVIGTAGCGTGPSGSLAPASPSAAAAASGSAGVSTLWPAPPDPMARAVQAGLKPGPREYATNHVHAHLDVFVDGKPITVPAGIGINITDPNVHRFDEPDGSVTYGGIQLCNEPCISPLHTHATSGILHTESSDPTINTLGAFFTEWGVPLDASCVGTFCAPATKIAIYVDGAQVATDPRTIELSDQRQIAIVIGTPPPQIPTTADFSRD